jgi:serine phosphatase RsbU (regulator of sigma subunit)/anti-sigma regulatory factor (Ser/Thr protein kinase)
MSDTREIGVREGDRIDRGPDWSAVSGAVRELAVVRVPVLILALLAAEVTGGGRIDDVFYYLLAGGGLYAAAALWLAFAGRGPTLPWVLYVGFDIALLSALVYTSGGGDSPIRPLFIVLPLIGVLSYSAYWTAVVGAVAVLDYLAVAGIHSAVEGGPSFGSIVVFSLFIGVGTLGATLPVHAVVQRQRAKAELEHRARLLAEQGARAEAEAVAETVRKLQRITDVTLGHLSLDELLPELLRKIVDVARSDAAAVLIAGDDLTLRASSTTGLGGVERGARVGAGEGFPGRVARTRQAITTTATVEEDRISRAFAEHGCRSLLGVPLTVDARLIGVLMVGAGGGRELGGVEADLLGLAADRIALSIQRAQLYEREHLIAQTLQRSLLPERLPEIPGLTVAARYLPAREEAKVGGDWYDVLELPGDAVGLAMGDVVSHGIRAASTMGQLRSAIRAYAFDREPPGETLTKLNTVVRGLDQRETATAVYLALDLAERSVRFASAGHPPPLVIDPTGRARLLEEGRSVPLGTHAATRYPEALVRLEPGSTIVLYTDGLVERRGSSLNEGLARLVSEASGDSVEPESLCDRLIGALLEDQPQLDDVALLAARVVPVPEERLQLELPCTPSTLAPLRRTVRHWLSGARASPGELQDILVAVSEAATNAVEHAYGPIEASYRVEGWLAGDRVVVTVTDSGSWRERRGPERGRGTQLMRALMDGFERYPSDAGTVVQLERRLGSRRPA